MTTEEKRIKVGIVGSSTDILEVLGTQVSATRLAFVCAEMDQYCKDRKNQSFQTFVEMQPEIVIVDMGGDPNAAIQTLHALRVVLPTACFFVSSNTKDPQMVIDSMQAGAREFLATPFSPRTLSLAFERYVTDKRRLQETKDAGKLYSVTAAKDGCGATCIAINVAISLALNPELRVALVDLHSPVGDITAYLDLKPEYNVSDALKSASRLDASLLESYMTQYEGVDVLAGVNDFTPGQMEDIEELPQVLEVITHSYTHTVIDFSCMVNGKDSQFLIEQSDECLLVLTPDLPALWRADRLLRFLGNFLNSEQPRLVINRSSDTVQIGNEEIEKALNRSVFWELPNNYRAAIAAINSGKPLVSMGSSNLAKNYGELACQLSGLPTSEEPGKLFGFLSSDLSFKSKWQKNKIRQLFSPSNG
jgi:pilus assembly protein CpaE